MSARLRQELASRAVALSQRVLDRLYENPFWMERYGERGRRFANEDSLHHINYLDQALAAGDPGVFTRYAQWLRTVLVSRGMCTEHLAENFRLLAEAIANDGLPDAGEAGAILLEGQRSLEYDSGDAAVLERAKPRLLDAVRTAQDPSAPMREDDRRYLVSYLIDAAATGDPRAFEAFAARFPHHVTAALAAAASLSAPPEAARPPWDGTDR
jgi:hypothetical protein